VKPSRPPPPLPIDCAAVTVNVTVVAGELPAEFAQTMV
jgi:hypothetical protein